MPLADLDLKQCLNWSNGVIIIIVIVRFWSRLARGIWLEPDGESEEEAKDNGCQPQKQIIKIQVEPWKG